MFDGVGRRVGQLVVGLVLIATVAGASAHGASAAIDNDATGKRWRDLTETTGLTASQVATVCLPDGVTACSGAVGGKDLTGWVWATDEQVRTLFREYAPAINDAAPLVVSSADLLLPAMDFLGAMAPTFSFTGYNFHITYAGGWTSTTDGAGQPVVGSVEFGWFTGSFQLQPRADTASSRVGVWLWRSSGEDITPPTITPAVTGRLGKNGWYVSDTSVSWAVADAESSVSTRSGCDPQTITADTAATTLACSATSSGGTATASVDVRRDATPPVVTCPSPAPVFQLHTVRPRVIASVSDATSRPTKAIAAGAADASQAGTFSTTISGFDLAGNRTTTKCEYTVVIPTCGGRVPTIVDKAGSNVIIGTSGADVIVALSGADTVDGLGGNDRICGNGGDDLLSGGAGDDLLHGGVGNDRLRGDDGVDTCVSGELSRSSCER